MRAGCNTGSCHGAARGKDGFRLSLFGFDPDGDHFRITREIGSAASTWPCRQRACCSKSRSAPCRTPAASGSTHDSEYYNTLLRWLEAGAPNDAGRTADGRRRRPLSAAGRARRRRRHAAVHRPRRLRRRHRPRRHEPGRVPDEQRQLGPDQRRRPGHRRRPRRSVRHGPLRHAHRRQPGARAAEGPAVHAADTSPATTSTSWSARS